MYRTKDNRWIYLACLQPIRYLPALSKAIEKEDLIDDLRFNSIENLEKNKQLLIAILDDAFYQKEAAEWEKILTKYEIVFETMRTLMEIAEDPHARENDFFGNLQDSSGRPFKAVNSPFKFSNTPSGIRNRSPEFSENTEEILLELNYSWEEIENLKQAQVIP
jgi:crotonobetainyl-CoA:carnitine CoA-transferase CaiB-like acyl-CoA transferase